ncbi:MAG: glycosyltransferase family 2 protein [Chlorobi bacterium]|nr:glycosyltransferase family 2 protein [Chlorobiota bacterium]
MPEISVILPFFNACKTLETSVLSVLNQRFENFELILVDNNSNDGSLHIAKKFADSDKRVKLLSEYRQGVVYASMKGLEYSSAGLIARADADDVWHPDKLKLQYEYLNKNPDTDVVSCRVNYVGNFEGMRKFVLDTNKNISHKEISLNRFVELQVINPTILFRKEIALKYGFYKEGDFPEDYEMFLRWLENGVKYRKLPYVLLDWYDSENRLTRTDKRYSADAFYRVKAGYLMRFLQENNIFFPDIVVWGAGRLSRKRAAYTVSSGVHIKYFIDVDINKIDGANIVNYKDIPEAGEVYVVSFVGNRGARDKIKEFLRSKNYCEGKDFLTV